MRRTELRRSKGLAPGKALEQRVPLRGTPLRRKPPTQPRERPQRSNAVKVPLRRDDLGPPTPPPATRPGEVRHHVIPETVQRRAGGHPRDGRNLLAIDARDHLTHHWSPRGNLLLTVLRDEHFAYAAALLGAGRAYNLLRRSYDGEDARLDALLTPAAGESSGNPRGEERDG